VTSGNWVNGTKASVIFKLGTRWR